MLNVGSTFFQEIHNSALFLRITYLGGIFTLRLLTNKVLHPTFTVRGRERHQKRQSQILKIRIEE